VRFLLGACELIRISVCEGIAVIVLKMLDATVQNLFAQANRRPTFVHPCFVIYFNVISNLRRSLLSGFLPVPYEKFRISICMLFSQSLSLFGLIVLARHGEFLSNTGIQHKTGVFKTRVASRMCLNNRVVYMHTRLTVKGVLKDFSKERGLSSNWD
jgi:hypothetical protein